MLVSRRCAFEFVTVPGGTVEELRRSIIRLSIDSNESRVRRVRSVVSAHCDGAILVAVAPFGMEVEKYRCFLA